MLKTVGPFVAVFALAFAVRAPHLSRPFPASAPGRTENERAAVSLARGGALGNVFAEDSGASAHLAPLYPWLLGQFYRIAARTNVDPRRAQETMATLFTCAALALLPLLARRARLHPASGWLAALLLSLVPGNRHFETSGCHEQPLVFLGLTALLLVFFRLHEQRWCSRRQVLLAAALLGGCALLGPMLLAPAALMVLVEIARLPGDRRAVLIGAGVLTITTILTLAPWAYRNHRVLGGWVWTRSNFGLELWIGNNPDANGQTYSAKFADLHPFGNAGEASEYRRLGELRYMRQKGNAAKEWIASHPGKFTRLTAWRAVWFWFPSRSMVWWDGRTWVAYLYGASTIGTLGGLILLFRSGHPNRWLFLAAIVGFTLPYLVTHVDVRYRYPLCGVCALLSCEVAVRLWRAVTSSPPR